MALFSQQTGSLGIFNPADGRRFSKRKTVGERLSLRLGSAESSGESCGWRYETGGGQDGMDGRPVAPE